MYSFKDLFDKLPASVNSEPLIQKSSIDAVILSRNAS